MLAPHDHHRSPIDLFSQSNEAHMKAAATMDSYVGVDDDPSLNIRESVSIREGSASQYIDI